MNYVVFDIEGNSLKPTKIHVLSWKDHEGNKGSITDYREMREFFKRDCLFVGHNIRRWDLPEAIKHLLDINVDLVGVAGRKVCDTLFVAWYLQPDRNEHNIESYGKDYGIEKPKIDDWEGLTLSAYIKRCETDVAINWNLFQDQLKHLLEIYESEEEVLRFLAYLDFKAYTAALAEESRWKLDKEYCQSAIDELSKILDDKFDTLRTKMPRVETRAERFRPARPYKADGQLSVSGQRWKDLTESRGLPFDFEGPVEEVTGSDVGNPSSPEQLKSWLYSLGWVPETIKHQRNKTTGETKEIPQINKDRQKGGGLCDSVKKLYDKEPALELLDSIGILKHRIGLLRGFIRDVDPDGFLSARVAGLTNTLRFKHAEIVNLPKVDIAYGKYLRHCLVADLGVELCGADMASLEDRLKQHYIYPYDPDYVADLSTDGYDPHLDLALVARALDPERINVYKKVDKMSDEDKKANPNLVLIYKAVKPVRSIYKNGNYACQYGAMPPRLSITCGIDLKAAQSLYKAYWKRNWAIKVVAANQKIKTLRGQMWLFNPISEFWYSLRFEKDVFSTLVQGSAVYCFDLWVRVVVTGRPQLTGQFHDEIILTVKKGHREEIKEYLEGTIKEVNEMLGLNRELGIGIQFGDRYSEIH